MTVTQLPTRLNIITDSLKAIVTWYQTKVVDVPVMIAYRPNGEIQSIDLPIFLKQKKRSCQTAMEFNIALETIYYVLIIPQKDGIRVFAVTRLFQDVIDFINPEQYQVIHNYNGIETQLLPPDDFNDEELKQKIQQYFIAHGLRL